MNALRSTSRLALSYLRLQLSGRGYRALTTAVMLLLFLATERGTRETALAISTYRAAVADEHAAWAEGAPEEWLAAGVRKGRWLYLEPLASQTLAEGVSKLQQGSCHVRVGVAPAHRLDLTDGALSWTPELRRLGSLDLGYVVLFLLPLWILFVSYDLVNGEKLRGTLKLALASGPSRSTVFAAKFVSSLLAVWTPTAAAILLGLLAGTYTYHAPWPDASRVLLFASILTAHILFYLCLGVLASTCTASPRTSLAVVMTLWAFFSFVQPRASVLAASLLRPSPSTVSFEMKKRAALAESRRSYVEEHHSGAAQSWMLERLVLAAEAIRREQALQRVHDDARADALGLVDAFMLLSPFGLTQSALVQVAGTDSSRYDRFRQACNDYRWQLTRHFVGAYEASKLQGVDPSTSELPRTTARNLLDNIPGSAYREDDTRTLLLRISARISALLVLALLLGVAALRNFERYDAR